jgi:hypothetical protein
MPLLKKKVKGGRLDGSNFTFSLSQRHREPSNFTTKAHSLQATTGAQRDLSDMED